MKIKKATFAAFSAALACTASAQLTDLWFHVGNNWEIDSQMADQGPMFDAKTDGNRVLLSAYAGDFSSFHIRADNSKNASGRMQMFVGPNGDGSIGGFGVDGKYVMGAFTLENFDGNRNVVQSNGKPGTGERFVRLEILGDLATRNNTGDSEIWVGENMLELKVGGNLIIENSATRLGADYSGLNKAVIEKDVIVKNSNGGKAIFQTTVGSASSLSGSFDNPDVHVKGIVDFSQATGGEWFYNKNDWDKNFSYIKIGGLQGSADLRGVTGRTESFGVKSVIAFANKAGRHNVFTGAIASGEDISALDSQKRLDLEMRGEAGGSQTLNITNAGFDGNVTVYSGTLLMGNTSSRRSNSGSDLFNQLVIEGGEFGAVGDAYFNDIHWNDNSGKLIVGFDGTNFDKITAYTFAFGSDMDKYTIVFDLGGADLEGRSFDISEILDITQALTDSQVAQLVGKVVGDMYTVDFSDGKFTFNAIPEPAAVAALFGVLVLALAACRRKK